MFAHDVIQIRNASAGQMKIEDVVVPVRYCTYRGASGWLVLGSGGASGWLVFMWAGGRRCLMTSSSKIMLKGRSRVNDKELSLSHEFCVIFSIMYVQYFLFIDHHASCIIVHWFVASSQFHRIHCSSSPKPSYKPN